MTQASVEQGSRVPESSVSSASQQTRVHCLTHRVNPFRAQHLHVTRDFGGGLCVRLAGGVVSLQGGLKSVCAVRRDGLNQVLVQVSEMSHPYCPTKQRPPF